MSTGYPVVQERKWSDEEIQRLRDYYPAHSAEQTAHEFGVTVKALDAVLRKHNIRKQMQQMYTSDTPAPRIRSKAGSGVIAPPAYRYGYASWGRGHRW